MLSRYLTRLGYQATLVENGVQALDKLQGEPFDLVLMDVQMPEMDGYQMLGQLKADTRLRFVEISFLLASIFRCQLFQQSLVAGIFAQRLEKGVELQVAVVEPVWGFSQPIQCLKGKVEFVGPPVY